MGFFNFIKQHHRVRTPPTASVIDLPRTPHNPEVHRSAEKQYDVPYPTCQADHGLLAEHGFASARASSVLLHTLGAKEMNEPRAADLGPALARRTAWATASTISPAQSLGMQRLFQLTAAPILFGQPLYRDTVQSATT